MTTTRAPGTHDLTTRRVKLSTLRPHPRNARNGDVEAVAESLTVNGQYRPIVVTTDGTILAGNHTYAAALSLGWDRISVVTVDVAPESPEALRIMLADNRTADLGGYDDALLLELLRDLDSLDGSGYVEDDVAGLELLAASLAGGSMIGDDDAPPVPDDAVSRPGDVWELGPHRLVVGDATDPDVWESLMGVERAHCVWTDPPYGVEYVGKTKKALTIDGDGRDLTDLATLLRAVLTQAVAHAEPGASMYVAAPPGPATLPFAQTLTDLGVWRQTLVWDKGTMVLGHSDYHYQHEVIYSGYVPGAAGRRGRGGQGWYGDNAQVSVLSYPKPSANREHPTMKPIDLVAHCLRNSVPPGGVVVDPFAGSGTTMLAAARVGAVARMVEVDPRYADVIAARWQIASGDVPVRLGEPVDIAGR